MSSEFLPGLEPRGAAVFSPCGLYRYVLRRHLGNASKRVFWCLLNPSTATAEVDDPTIRRCIGYTRDWGFGALDLVNMFAWRSTDPAALRKVADPVGPDNDFWIAQECKTANRVVVAWGNDGALFDRDKSVLKLICENAKTLPVCLGFTKNGSPVHPLYQSKDAQLQPVHSIELLRLAQQSLEE